MSAKASLLVLVGGLVALGWYGGPGPRPAEPPVRLSSGHAHENLTVFVLRGPDVLDGRNILTLQEALEKGVAVVHETSNVNLLEVENLSADHEVFLQSGDIVKGGKQDRLVSADMLVPAKSGRTPCPANCCEHSRWQGRGQEAAGKFEKSTDFAVGNPIKLANYGGQQGAVWANVQKCQDDLSQNLGKPVTANASPTSLQLALEDKDLRAKVAGYERTLGGLAAAYPDAVGAVVAVNGRVIASDVYGSHALFRKAWPKLVKSAAVDAVAQLPKDGTAAVASREEAEKFLAEKDAAAEPHARGGQNALASLAGNTNASWQLGLRQDVVLSRLPEPEVAPRSITPQLPAIERANLNPSAAQGTEETRRSVALARLSESVNQSVDVRLYGSSPQPVPAAAGVVSFESRAGSQGNALLHRGQLKK